MTPRANRVLIASDDDDLNSALSRLLREHAPAVSHGVTSEAILLEADRRDAVRVVLVADSRAEASALDALPGIKRQRPDLAVLVLSRCPTIEAAAESIRRGAEDFVPLPYSEDIVRKEVARILEAAELRDRIDQLDRFVSTRYGFDRVISRSPAMRDVFDRGNAAARSNTPVLIVGETGTGKELIARAIHANSRRAGRPFVPVNCAALPRDLLESELFGHRRGAFSGATTDHPGLFVSAHGGTLFLDEVGELPLEAQAKLLRVLQNGEVRAVGGLDSRRVDVRMLAATNRSLAALRDHDMRDVRQDLFFRLSVLVIQIPPLRSRREDLPLLAAHFLAAHGRGNGRSIGLEAAALERVPAGRDDWKPHPKSMPLGRLAGLVASMPSWVTLILTQDELDLTPAAGTGPYRQPAIDELTGALDQHVAKARETLLATTDAFLLTTNWRLKANGQVVADERRHVVLRDTLNHLAHHRGQLTVYLRLLDQPVPAIYGPSADDQRFA